MSIREVAAVLLGLFLLAVLLVALIGPERAQECATDVIDLKTGCSMERFK